MLDASVAASVRPRSSIAIHVGADLARRGTDGWWPPGRAALDTVGRAARIGDALGFDAGLTLVGEHATVGVLSNALRRAATTLASDGALMLTFSGHTERGKGPLPTARWCLFDGGLTLATMAVALGSLPAAARILVVCDTCYGAGITEVLAGPQRVVVVASCGDDQMMIDRRRSEFLVRMEALVRSGDATLAELRDLLEADTPDCERPCVWTNVDAWWASPIVRARPRRER
jgi:hypothetical protein